ncbi:hypothetical protein LXA43DRAFT_1105507 [Ganoderma leucocontextum]|nr:hypothetical protein LXA43DRAFT_1105507 [Ganoderma leucocontextum]
MSTQGQAPWELYAKTMFNHFGFPLWHSDPEVDQKYGPREVELGSVSFLDRGKFRHLFNARKEAGDPFNAGRVPDTFEPFNPPNLTITAPQPILRQHPEANLVSVGGSISFACKKNTGAFKLLVLDQPAMGQSTPTKRQIVSYIRRHMDSWFEYATGFPDGLGYDLQMHDIKFVSGTLKTTKWACAVFSGSYRNKKGSLNVNAAGIGGFDMNVSIENQIIPPEFYNNGPSSRTSDSGTFDPVVILLDYMLAKTEAEYAVASDRDLLAIFGEAGVPDDIMTGLEAVNPLIHVDENGVATVDGDDSVGSRTVYAMDCQAEH